MSFIPSFSEPKVEPDPVDTKSTERLRTLKEKTAKVEAKKQERERKRAEALNKKAEAQRKKSEEKNARAMNKQKKAKSKVSKGDGMGDFEDSDAEGSVAGGEWNLFGLKKKKPRAEYEAEIDALQQQLAQKNEELLQLQQSFARQSREHNQLKAWAKSPPIWIQLDTISVKVLHAHPVNLISKVVYFYDHWHSSWYIMGFWISA